jgi:predicted membrane-bound dolichyl-phosphate-mannose-protein mannosyltransferase
MYLVYYLFHVLSFPCIVLAFLCITLATFDVFTCIILAACLSAQHKFCGALINKVTYTATVEQKRLRCFTCCLVLTLFRVTLFNLRLFTTK